MAHSVGCHVHRTLPQAAVCERCRTRVASNQQLVPLLTSCTDSNMAADDDVTPTIAGAAACTRSKIQEWLRRPALNRQPVLAQKWATLATHVHQAGGIDRVSCVAWEQPAIPADGCTHTRELLR